MDIDPWILTFSALTVLVTIWMGFWSAKRSKTASDFFVAGRSVSVGWNASAISGEYLSAASFMGVAGMVMSSGYDALWYPVCYACGYLFLLLFIAGPLRRFGAYTIPDFAEGRFDSPLFRKIAVVFVLFIGFFYTMPQMKGAGTTLSYIFQDLDFRGTPLAFLAPHEKGEALKGLHYGVGVFLVGAVITLNVALGGMKGITLVQAFQYWAKMFAISVPIFVLMAVYGHYGRQLEVQGDNEPEIRTKVTLPFFSFRTSLTTEAVNGFVPYRSIGDKAATGRYGQEDMTLPEIKNRAAALLKPSTLDTNQLYSASVGMMVGELARILPRTIWVHTNLFSNRQWWGNVRLPADAKDRFEAIRRILATNGVTIQEHPRYGLRLAETADWPAIQEASRAASATNWSSRLPLPTKASLDNTWFATSGSTSSVPVSTSMSLTTVNGWATLSPPSSIFRAEERLKALFGEAQHYSVGNAKLVSVLMEYTQISGRTVVVHTNVGLTRMLGPLELNWNDWSATIATLEGFLKTNGLALREESARTIRVMLPEQAALWDQRQATPLARQKLPEKAPRDETWLNPFGPLTTKAASAANAIPRWNLSSDTRATLVDYLGQAPPTSLESMIDSVENLVDGKSRGKSGKKATTQFADWTNMPPNTSRTLAGGFPMLSTLYEFGLLLERPVWVATNLPRPRLVISGTFQTRDQFLKYLEFVFLTNGVRLDMRGDDIKAVPADDWDRYVKNPARVSFVPNQIFSMRQNVEPRILAMSYGELLGKDAFMAASLPTNYVDFNPSFEVMLDHEARAGMEKTLKEAGITIIPAGSKEIWAVPTADMERYKLAPVDPRPLSLLYTYSLIIALVCGTAGLPHILVRFYTNPDGVAAKRTTMWVMILIGVFYLFPPVFGVMGRNLMPDLYNGLAGVKGTDGIVLKLPKLLSERFGVLGSVLSGVTCAGAFAAFMSTFSGLLVSMTGALAHDVYGRILRPKSTPNERMKMFKLCAVIVGAGAMLLGFLVESFEINKMVGWAFAIAATSYFPLLFLSTWWRGITMKGAATGMLVGGTLSLVAIASTMFADQAAWAAGMKDYYAAHPLLRILAEQPAIWALPLALVLMFLISKLTAKDVPADIRMKMLVLHAPEKLGLKQEFIQEHQAGH